VVDHCLAFQAMEGWRMAENPPSLETREGGIVSDLHLAFRAKEGWRVAKKTPLNAKNEGGDGCNCVKV